MAQLVTCHSSSLTPTSLTPTYHPYPNCPDYLLDIRKEIKNLHNFWIFIIQLKDSRKEEMDIMIFLEENFLFPLLFGNFFLHPPVHCHTYLAAIFLV